MHHDGELTRTVGTSPIGVITLSVGGLKAGVGRVNLFKTLDSIITYFSTIGTSYTRTTWKKPVE
jgi:hypothetical protein